MEYVSFKKATIILSMLFLLPLISADVAEVSLTITNSEQQINWFEINEIKNIELEQNYSIQLLDVFEDNAVLYVESLNETRTMTWGDMWELDLTNNNVSDVSLILLDTDQETALFEFNLLIEANVSDEEISNDFVEVEEETVPLTGLVAFFEPDETSLIVAGSLLLIILLILAYYRTSTVAGLTKRADKLHKKADDLDTKGNYSKSTEKRKKASELQRKADEKNY